MIWEHGRLSFVHWIIQMRKKLFTLLLLLTVTMAFGQVKVYDQYADLEKEYMKKLDPEVTYVINFWATWCVPCVKELPYFEELTEKQTGKVKVILVSIDFDTQLESKVIPFIQKNNLQSEVVLLADPDSNHWIDEVDPSWSGAIPVTLVLKGKKRLFFEKQYEDYEELLKDVESI